MCYVYSIVINLQDVVSSGQEFLHRQKSVSSELEVCEFSLIMFTLGVNRSYLYTTKSLLWSPIRHTLEKAVSVNRLKIRNL